MCGRITQRLSNAELADYFDADPLSENPLPRFNLAPTQPATVVVAREGRRALARFEWGLVPSWEQAQTSGVRLINARAETLVSNATFRDLVRRRRCIVPADAFYEWQHAAAGRQPFSVRRSDGLPLAVAGLWIETASPIDGKPAREPGLPAFTIVTTAANRLVGRLHDRMPVLLAAESWGRWLDPTLTEASAVLDLLGPAPEEGLVSYPVSRRVNDVRNDDPSLATPLDGVDVVIEQPGLFDAELAGQD